MALRSLPLAPSSAPPRSSFIYIFIFVIIVGHGYVEDEIALGTVRANLLRGGNNGDCGGTTLDLVSSPSSSSPLSLLLH